MKFIKILQVIALRRAGEARVGAERGERRLRCAMQSTVVVKNPFGLCWRSGQWSEGKAIR